MLSLSTKDNAFLALEPIDFRRQINGLIRATKEIIKENPFSGSYFVFTNKKKTCLKILHYDGQGYWLHQKRLSKGKFCWPKSVNEIVTMSAMQLQVLLMNGQPDSAGFQDDWRQVA
jgi:transposase